MASNTECLIIVLDVRRAANDELKLKSVKCAAEILKDKICCDKKDFVSFVLVGCANTQNELNDVMQDTNQHIMEYEHVQCATWQLLLNFFRFVNEEPCDGGQWLDGIAVAVDKLKKAQGIFKFKRQRILLFYDFNLNEQNYEHYKEICEELVKEEIDLIVSTPNIAYIDNAETGLPQAIFKSTRKSSDAELKNQKYALRLVSDANATLCNLKDVLITIFKVRNKRPWTWNSKLIIGKKIDISISGIIVIKNESHIKLKKCWTEAEETVTREIKYYYKGVEVKPLPDDIINGYMLGGTPVVYDESLVAKPCQYTPGLVVIGFVKRSDIPDVYFGGDSQYMVVHRRGCPVSAKKLDALVRALHNTECAVLCWKTYSVKYNQPKIVVLLPNDITTDCPATLTMLDLSYHVQHHYWDFPALRTQKTECTDEQTQAIDKLIDSMDLELTLQHNENPRNTRQHDLLPFDELPHIYEQNLMDLLERKVLCNVADDEQFQEMLTDKNFVEIYWKVPEPIEEQGKRAANKIKQLFPLEQSHAWLEKLKAANDEKLPIKTEAPTTSSAAAAGLSQLNAVSVGEETPAKDFEQLIKHEVLTLESRTERDAKFIEYAKQIRAVLIRLLSGNPIDFDYEKLILAFSVHRKRSAEFHGFAEHNTFMYEVRALAVERNLKEFWAKVICKHKLGLLVLGKPTIEEEMRADEFYVLRAWQGSNALLDAMHVGLEGAFLGI